MPKLSKKFSFNFLKGKKKQGKKDEVDSSMSKRAKDTDIQCNVLTLDNTTLTFYLEKRTLGKVLEDYTFHQIEILDDKNYFGLQYTDKNGHNHWLDMTKQVRKQCEIGPPYNFRFRVKFFSSDPCGQMSDEYTRYMFVLQLKQMIKDGELQCEDLDLASDLAALQLQGELGDYNAKEHSPFFISQFRFLPESQQTEEFELAVLEKYQIYKDRGMVPSITDKQYLEKCRFLPDYGVDRHKTKNIQGKENVLGLTPTGILIYEGSEKIGMFPWNQVLKLSFTKNCFKIVAVQLLENEQGEEQHTFIFQSDDVASCKQLWKSCVENHSFFRLEGSHKPPTKFQQLFRLKSRFYASSHTEYQMAMKNNFGSGAVRASNFQRAPSVKLAPRPSFERNEAERRKIQQKYRDQFRTESREFSARNINSGDYDDSNESTPVPSPLINKPLLALTSHGVPRLTSQDSSATKTSTISRQSSSNSSGSANSVCFDDYGSGKHLQEAQITNQNSTKNDNGVNNKPQKKTGDASGIPRKNSKRQRMSRGSTKDDIICV